jgi:thiol-disulfide isomerase/thioredoxin
MKIKTFLAVAFALLGCLLASQPSYAAPSTNATAELQELVAKIQTKLEAGKNTEKELADELKEFDDLLTKHKGEKTDDVASILFMEAMLYVQVLDNTEKGAALLTRLKTEFPDTKPGKNADEILASIKKQAEAKKIKAALVDGAVFPDFAEKDLAGKPLAIANFKGKVVLVDFWATWCGPCVAELPSVLKAYEKYHAKGFEIIGISLDKDEAALNSFIKKKNLPWPQYFDGQGWQNKLAGKYGITSIPATYLLNGEGKIIGQDLRGDALDEAVSKALAKK